MFETIINKTRDFNGLLLNNWFTLRWLPSDWCTALQCNKLLINSKLKIGLLYFYTCFENMALFYTCLKNMTGFIR